MLRGMKLSACGAVVGLAIFLLSGTSARCKDEKDWWATATDPKNFSATVTFTTDYVLRGISQTDSKPAVQGSLDYKHPSGAYIGIWGSNVDDSISKGDLELDIYGGYTFELFSNFNLDASIIYYYYPGCGHDPSKNFFEGHLGADYTFKDLPLEPKLSGAAYYSPDYFGQDGDAYYVTGRLDLALPWELTLYGLVGYQWVEGDQTTGHHNGDHGGNGYDYVTWRIGVTRPVLGFTLELFYSDTDNAAYLGKSIADERVVFQISRTF